MFGKNIAPSVPVPSPLENGGFHFAPRRKMFCVGAQGVLRQGKR